MRSGTKLVNMTHREIKYKRYHFDRNGTCIAVSWWGRNIDGFEFRSPTFISSEDPDKATDCQFTGLQDKNGVDIYEWDILKSNTTGINYTVEFTRGAFECKSETTMLHRERFSQSSIIGNIHQNTELL